MGQAPGRDYGWTCAFGGGINIHFKGVSMGKDSLLESTSKKKAAAKADKKKATQKTTAKSKTATKSMKTATARAWTRTSISTFIRSHGSIGGST